jgi:hypothetical protein
VFLLVYATLLIQVWRWLRGRPTRRASTGVTANRLQQWAHSDRAYVIIMAAAGCDFLENVLRLVLVRLTVTGKTVETGLIVTSWLATTAKFLLLGICVAMLVVLVCEKLPAASLTPVLCTLWRLRIGVIAVALFVALLLADPTGQAIDLARRWVGDTHGPIAWALAVTGSVLLGLAVWLMARRVVLADHHQAADDQDPDRTVRRWRISLATVAVSTVVLAWLSGWLGLVAVGIVALVILALGSLWRIGPMAPPKGPEAAARDASRKRAAHARKPEAALLPHTYRASRALAIIPPVTLLALAAAAYAPVLVLLPLSGKAGTDYFVRACAFTIAALIGAPLMAAGGWIVLRRWDGDGKRTPRSLEVRYKIAVPVILGTSIGSIIGGITHLPGVSAFVVVPAFLATVVVLLGEGQRWSETHAPPPGLLAVNFTRVPVTALLVVIFAIASYWLSDGSAHAVHRQRTLPGTMTPTAGSRTGISLESAFSAWVAGNCAGPGHADQSVPLILVAAPGGGLRAAYWTGSSLSELFGAARTPTVSGCGASPSDRIFAMGGASGGSLGALAYTAGLEPDASGPRAERWYDEQLARPDFLTDPLAWMLTVDFARAWVGFGGQDRARRLEDIWSRHIGGLDRDFFDRTWGLGGHNPVMLLTGTQVETGCRLNIGGVRLTTPPTQPAGRSCAALPGGSAQADAPITSDVLDYLCGADKGTGPESVSRSTAALLSARFPYVSPSGQMYGCADGTGAPGPANAPRTAVVDGGYADNTGIGMLLAMWPRLERLIASHNSKPGNATVVPVFLEVDNHYAQVAAPSQPGRTIEMLVPPSTKSRPDRLDDRAMEAQAAAVFTGPLPGTEKWCDVTGSGGRFVKINPRTSPGLPAPLAWTLSRLATDDLNAQREAALDEIGPGMLRSWAANLVACR